MQEINARDDTKLLHALGKDCIAALEDPHTIEVVLNPDGQLWQETLVSPFKRIGRLDSIKAESAMGIIASRLGLQMRYETPIIEGELELASRRFRFAGQIPPIVRAPAFAIRVPASRVFPLSEYVKNEIMTPYQYKLICEMVHEHRNMIVMGGTGSGKTTLLNGIIHEMVSQFPEQRFIIMEDTGEIQCSAKNAVIYRTSPHVGLSDLLKTTLRMRPDRILVGEVRDHAALDLLDAWNTGHEGGVATIHANNIYDGLVRLKSMVSRSKYAPNDIESIIGQAVHAVIHISKTPKGRKISGIMSVHGWDNQKAEYITSEE